MVGGLGIGNGGERWECWILERGNSDLGCWMGSNHLMTK